MGTGGGAATHSGVDYQQRVSAWFVTLMLAKFDASALVGARGPFVPVEVSYETSASIDDIQITPESGLPLLVQAKRRIFLSAQPDSEFASVVGQFVGQLLAERDDSAPQARFALVVGPESSRAVQITLARTLADFRLHASGPDPRTMSEQAVAALNTFRNLTQVKAKELLGAELSPDEFRNFARRTHIICLDVEMRRPHETVALVLLRIGTDLPAALVWSHLVTHSLDLAKHRSRLDRSGAESLVEPFGFSEADSNRAVHEELALVLAAPPSGRELIFARVDGWGDESDRFLLEFYRFDEHGEKRLRFDGTRFVCTSPTGEDGLTGTFDARSATRKGLLRRVEMLDSIDDLRITIAFKDDLLERDQDQAALEWGRRVRDNATGIEALRCLHCGRAVGASSIELVELDDEQHDPVAGVVHAECLRPADRSLGVARVPFFEGKAELRDFDLHVWVEALPTGQRMMNSLRSKGLPVYTVLWNPENSALQAYDWCVRLDTKDGFSTYVHTRGRLHRLKKSDAQSGAAALTAEIEASAAGGDPLVVADVSLDIARQSTILNLRPTGDLHECTGAEAVRYSRSIGTESNERGDYYAPLFYIIERESEEVVLFCGSRALFSDPLEFPRQIRALAEYTSSLPTDYAIRILRTDSEFDLFVHDAVERQEPVVIDPFPGDEGGLQGVRVTPMSQFVSTAADAEVQIRNLAAKVIDSASKKSRRRRRKRRGGA